MSGKIFISYCLYTKINADFFGKTQKHHTFVNKTSISHEYNSITECLGDAS